MKLAATAKINLGLDVLGRRPDGYHDLESILQQISLADFLTIRADGSSGLRFRCSNPGLGGVNNLVFRAARALAEMAGKELPGVKLSLFKNIPSGSGLGGGSSDAAAALEGLNKFWGLGLTSRELIDLGSKLGSDIPFFLRGGTALIGGRGENMTPLPSLPFFWVVLAWLPRLSISTASVFGSLGETIAPVPPIDVLREFICRGDRRGILNWLSMEGVNSLEPPVLARYPCLEKLKMRMKRLGLSPVMSGSGPTFFSLSESYLPAHRAVRLLRAKGYRALLCWTVQRKSIDRGLFRKKR